MTEKNQDKHVFEHVAKNASGHFVLCIYAAVYRLLYQMFRLSEAGGSSLDDIFARYPFLNDYFSEMRGYMPRTISWEEGAQWWQQQLESWEQNADSRKFPLLAIAQGAQLTYTSRMAIMLVGLVEEDSRFGTLFSELQVPLVHRRPTLELVGQTMMSQLTVGDVDPWAICKPLLELGIVDAPNKDAARAEWALKVPPLLWDAAKGKVDAKPIRYFTLMALEELIDIDDLIIDATLHQKLKKIPYLIESKIARLIIVRGVQGSNTKEVLGCIARSRQQTMLYLEPEALEVDFAQCIAPLCTMANAMPVFHFDLAPGETVNLPRLMGYDGPVGVIMGPEGGLRDESTDKAISLNLLSPGIDLRRQYWQKALDQYQVENIEAVAENFRLPGAYIQQAAEMSVAHSKLNAHEQITLEDIREASRSLNRQLLDSLASHLEAEGTWDKLIAGDGTLHRLQELYLRCRNREKLVDHLGPGFGSNSNCGVRALLTGASGTGKTLAAKIIAAELGMDLYRVDLAAIVNKYIGETEKNLHRILSRAEALDVVLLLDEGDALLGSRTDVKSANDRYANLETNYLLQRLEHYQGIVLITTNLAQNIDRAFQRRMDILIPFYSPQAEERYRILYLHLPDEHEIDDKYLEMVASHCPLSGGQIRNVALHATLCAMDSEVPVNWSHLEAGLRGEYRKAGGTFPLEGNLQKPQRDVDIGRFAGALNAR